MAIVSRAAMGIPVTVVGAVGDGVERGIGAMIGRETADLTVGLTAARMAARGVAPVAAARVILTLHVTTLKPGSLRGDAAKSATGVREVGISCACMCATI